MGTPDTELALFQSSSVPSAVRVSPKRPREETAGLADLFPYYAGFSYEWARARLASLEESGRVNVLDPWNGSGTTTLAAASLGLPSIGVDLNPIANIVARLRSRGSSIRPARIAGPASPSADVTTSAAIDPLCAWFCEETAARLRQWQVELASYSQDTQDLGLIALFRVVRQLTKSFEGSNPTWVRRARRSEERRYVATLELDDSIRDQEYYVSRRLRSVHPSDESPLIVTASSRNLPLKRGSIDAIVTSPPYLTRIDYAVAYTRELAVLGLDTALDRRLRSALMGTTLIRGGDISTTPYGPLATSLLREISEHPSKDSSGYYRKQARQYIEDLIYSIAEMARVASQGTVCHIVVQDSYYKDIQIPLARLLIEEAERLDWILVNVEAFPVSRILTAINASAQSYNKGSVSESAITLRRAS